MKNIAIIQARMTSSRLPGKTLLPLSGKPVLEHVTNRVKKSKFINKVIVATSNHISDNPIEDWCNLNQIECFRGSLNDVLDRYYQAACFYNAKNILRITADCPVIDFEIIDEVIQNYHLGNYDYYGLCGDFPDGLDCTMISFNSLESAWKYAKLNSEREHVGPYIEKNAHKFKVGGYFKFKNLAHIRLTLDEFNDYKLLSNIFDYLYTKDNYFGHQMILELLYEKPDLLLINNKIQRNEGYINSILNDSIL